MMMAFIKKDTIIGGMIFKEGERHECHLKSGNVMTITKKGRTVHFLSYSNNIDVVKLPDL